MRLSKYCMLISVVLFCTYVFNGCSSRQISSLTPTNKIQMSQELQGTINRATFLNTIQKYDANLYNDPRVSEAFFEKKVLLKQQYIDQDNTYIVVWSNDLGFTSILEVYEKKGSSWEPIYYNKFGMKINALRIMDDVLEKNILIEITHYIKGIQKVTLLCLDFEKISTVWEYITIQEDISSKNLETTYENNSYIIIPGYLKPSSSNDNTPMIIVHNRYDISTLNGTKVLKNKNVSKDIYYIWDMKKQKFVEKSGP